MEKRKKLLILATIILAVAAIVLVVTSLATENWVESTPIGKNSTAANSKNDVSFGLFKGKKVLDFGFSQRLRKIASEYLVWSSYRRCFHTIKAGPRSAIGRAPAS